MDFATSKGSIKVQFIIIFIFVAWIFMQIINVIIQILVQYSNIVQVLNFGSIGNMLLIQITIIS